MPDLLGNPALRDHYPIVCKKCHKRILGNSYRVFGMEIQENGIPVSLYSHKDCLSPEDVAVEPRSSFDAVAYCLRCGEPTDSNEFECDTCKRLARREMVTPAEMSEAAREFLAALAKMQQERLAAQRQQEAAFKEEHQGAPRKAKPVTDIRDIEVARLQQELPPATTDDFGPFVPTNESGVVFIAGEIAKDLGYRAARISTSYPDALFVSPANKLLKVEFEYASGNFIQHGHDPALCDLVICWKKDRELPIPVLELGRYYDPKTGKWDLRGA